MLTERAALIVVDAEGENTITLAPGANRRFEAAESEAVDAVLAQLEVPVEQITAVFEGARARGVRCFLNAAPAPVVDERVRALLAVTDVVIVNESEASALVGSTFGDPVEQVRALLESGPALAVLTLGKAGAVGATADAVWRQPGFAVRAVDTVGAGDAFSAVFAASLAEDASVPVALRLACAAGALTAARPGAQAAPLRAEIEAFLEAGPDVVA